MGSYYYLVPTLPAIKPNSSSYMSFEEFLAICKDKVSKKDYEILSKATLTGGEVGGNKFMRDFSHFRSMVEKELVQVRSQALNRNEERYVNKGDKENIISQTVKKAVEAENPLEGEKIILSLYFKYLEDHVGVGHYFDLTYLLSYALRLQLLSRLSLFTPEKGNDEFMHLFDSLKKEIFK